MAKAGGGKRKLAQMERVRELVAPAQFCDRITEDEFRRLMHEETIVVEFEPERAKRALPKLLRTRGRPPPCACAARRDALALPAGRAPAGALRRAEDAVAAAGGHGGRRGEAAAEERRAPRARRGTARRGANLTAHERSGSEHARFHQPHVRRDRGRRDRDGLPHADGDRCRSAGARGRRRRGLSCRRWNGRRPHLRPGRRRDRARRGSPEPPPPRPRQRHRRHAPPLRAARATSATR